MSASSAACPSCIVCGGVLAAGRTPDYRRCTGCGHEMRLDSHVQSFMLNDPLDREDVRRVSSLDRFKLSVVARFAGAASEGTLLDVGCATGKFLALARGRHGRVFGVEVTPEAVAFAREALALDVYDNVRDVPGPVDVATLWHSLEHIPAESIRPVLAEMAAKMRRGGRVIVCVPNARSLQYRLFGEGYAFYDPPNHPHQFSPASLALLMRASGFEPVGRTSSMPYNIFGWVQGLLNLVTRTHNYLYYRLKRRAIRPAVVDEIASWCTLPIAAAVGGLLWLVERTLPEREGVITQCFQKK